MAEVKTQLRLESAAFQNGKPIPAAYTADGKDVSPALSWSGVPPESKSLALLCEDPDAPRGIWVHWVLYDLPSSAASLPEAVPPRETLPGGGTHGRNDFGKLGYGGPAPPSGTHRYFFKLYAVDRLLALAPGATRGELLRAIEGHVLARGELVGTYSRR
ncbi:MAG: YbhB/YbcL family Raf kinase inhibitor-like protein [Thermoanaerobaculia bacterium]